MISSHFSLIITVTKANNTAFEKEKIMKKALLVSLILAVGLFAVGTVHTVSASSLAPSNPVNDSLYGFGGRGGRMAGAGLQDGILHDKIVEVFASELGISVDEVNSRLAAGETMSEIALSEGLTLEEFDALMDKAMDTALDQAVTDGLLTQTQADSMQQHSWNRSNGIGNMRANNTARGAYASGTCINQ